MSAHPIPIDESQEAQKDATINVELEAALLGAVLIDNGLFDYVADIIAADDFAYGLHRRIYEAALQHHAETGVTSPAKLFPLFKEDPQIAEVGGPSYLAKLTADSSSLLAPIPIAKDLAAIGRRRRLVEGLKAATEAAQDPHTKIGEAIGIADEAMSERTRQAMDENSAGHFFDQMIKQHEDGDTGIECGRVPSLDAVLGKLKPGQFTVIAARPSMGKTAVAISYGIGAAQRGHGTVFYSLEMLGAEFAQRVASDLCYDQPKVDVPFEAIQTGQLGFDQMEQVQIAKEKANNLPLTIAAGTGLTVGRLASSIRRNKRRMEAAGNELKLVIVDYLQLLRTDVRMNSEYEAVSEISRTLKEIAIENGVSLVALAQLSRAVEQRENKRPMMSDLRSSGQIEQDADNIAFLLRQEYYLERERPPERNDKWEEYQSALAACREKIEFIGGKRRNGVVLSATGQFFGKYQAVRG